MSVALLRKPLKLETRPVDLRKSLQHLPPVLKLRLIGSLRKELSYLIHMPTG